MSDLIDSLFEEGDDFYPGSKRKIAKKPLPASTPRPHTSSDRFDIEEYELGRSVVKTIMGRQVRLYTIQSLASVINKSVVSIRLWERKRLLPPAPFRAKAAPGARNSVAGRRYYNDASLEAAWEVFRKPRDGFPDGLLDAPRVEWQKTPEITREIRDAWDKVILDFRGQTHNSTTTE